MRNAWSYGVSWSNACWRAQLALCLGAIGLPICGFLGAPASVASAQPAPTQDFSSYRFYMAPGRGNFLAVHGTGINPELRPSFGASFDYALRPFVADDLLCFTSPSDPSCSAVERDVVETPLVEHAWALSLRGALTVFERFQLGLQLPLLVGYDGALFQYVETGTTGPAVPRQAAPGGSGVALGDPEFSVKVPVLEPDVEADVELAMSVLGWVKLPFGHLTAPDHFVGDPLPRGGAAVLGSLKTGVLSLAVNLGAALREERTHLRSQVGTEMTWGVGGAVALHRQVDVLAELVGATSFGQRVDTEAPTEVRAAGRLSVEGFAITAGLGAGLVYGVGVPVVRFLAGVRYAPAAAVDRDGDGVMDAEDGCPVDPEDRDGYADEDGCPDADNDRDGVPDVDDACPDEAEDHDGFADEDGCPDNDDDGDGVPDGYDSCPREPEDRDGDRDDDGCPETDADRDGIPDDQDRCPHRSEDFDGFADADGCPEVDADDDGIRDTDDQCPDQAEDRDGVEDEDGCPDLE